MPRQDRPIPPKAKVGRKPGSGGANHGRGQAHFLLPTPVPPECHKLTLLEARFVIEYMKDCNAEQAAIRAGYKARSAPYMAAQVLSRDKVRTALKIQLDARANRTQVTTDRVVSEIAKIAFADIRSMFTPDGALKPIPDMTAEQAALIESLEIDELYDGKDGDGRPKWIGKTKRAKLYNRLKSLETLAKHLGILSDKMLLDVNTTNTNINRTEIKVEAVSIGSLDTHQLEQLYAIANSLQTSTGKVIDTTGTDTGPSRH